MLAKVCSGCNTVHFVKPDPTPSAKMRTLCGLKLEPVRSWEAGTKGSPDVSCKTCLKLECKYANK